MSGVPISDCDFAAAQPFGFCVDGEGRLCLVGSSLASRHGLAVGDPALDHFEITGRGANGDLLALPTGPKRALALRLRNGSLIVRGCLLELEDGRRAFLGSPVVSSLEEAKTFALKLGDFPPHDPTPDLLLNLQTTETSLRDARKLSKDLEVALAEAKAAVDAKSRFLAVMSHEIRTPLNGFGAMVDLLRHSALTPAQEEQVDVIDDCAKVLLQLINDILDWSRNDAQSVELQAEATAVERVVSAAVSNFEAQALTKGVALELQIAADVPEWVRIDPARTRQVVANLVGNAVKFTSRGSVRVEVDRVSPERLRIDVRDSGIGVPEEARGRLFRPFEQVDGSRTRRYGGSGLGLSIARQLARAMGGDVELHTTSEQGSVFRFEFQFEPAEAQQRIADEARADVALPSGLRVLVAEDERTNQLIIRRLLTRLAVECDVVSDGLQAVEAIEYEAYDLVLMDMMMPNLSGIDACRRIRSSDVEWRDLPIVACSAAVFDTDRQEASRAGMDGFLSKPVRLEQLRETLVRHLVDTDDDQDAA